MSKHNHNTNSSASRRCYCGRYITIGEEAAGIGVFSYTCPDCSWRENHERWLQREAEEERRQFDNHGLGIKNN